MKKILLATAAVALTAGAASADVTFSGYGRAGIKYTKPKGGSATTVMTSRFRFVFTATKTTDSGLQMGVKMRMQSDAGTNQTGVVGGVPTTVVGSGNFVTDAGQMWLQQGGLKVEFNNVDGPIENMPGLYDPSVGLTGIGYGGMVTNFTDAGGTHSFDWLGAYQGYSTAGTYGNAAGVQVNYTMGGLTAMVARGGLTGNNNTSTQGVVAYNFGQFTAALGYSSGSWNGSQSQRTIGTVTGKVGPVNLTLGVARNASITSGVKNPGITKYALNAAYTMGAITMNAYYAHQSGNIAGVSNAYGIGGAYDIGGASLKAGVAKDPSGSTVADFGVIFSF